MIKKLFLDLNNFKANLGSVERGDSIELNIKLLDGEDYSRSKFRVLGAKADGKYVEQIEGINLEEKDLKIVLEDQFVNCEGIVKLELNVVSGETEITTKEFYFFVSNTMNGEIVESSDSVPTLEKVSKYVDYAVNNLDALKEASADITIINSEFKENEIKRKANELLRERSEKERVRLESVRTTEEADRIKAEAERKEAENNRKVAESNRKLAENTRKTNEANRVRAELNRQSLFEENEEIRNSNENLRIEAEKERKLTFSNNNKFESERVEAEKLRAIAEDKRVTAEKARANAEEERIKAETRRENTYTDFNDSEVERKNNEANRVRAEAERVNAESGRNELFNTNEEKRNSTFIESERTRERAFNEAQSNRNEAFEESERVREEAFKVSEAIRNEAEEGRVAAELLRVEAEKLRVAGEENRNNTFTQSEEERKGVFEEAENARKVAESKRVKAESSRGETEKLRVTAETGRVEAESLRVTAEEERVAAETKREEGFNKFEGRISANTEELKNARTATTGEKFNTLDERIDCEVDRLNKKIDVTMLQQEDKESHDINNTVDGMTTDMVIKGRTLQNVMPELNKSNFNFTGETNLVDGFFVIPFGVDVNASLIGANRKKTILKPNTKYTVIADILENNTGQKLGMSSYGCSFVPSKNSFDNSVGISMITGTTKDNFNNVEIKTDFLFCIWGNGGDLSKKIKFKAMVLEGDWTNKPIPEYFEGIKSFGQEENKISILSHGKNLINESEFEDNTLYYMDTGKKQSNSTYKAFSLKVIPNKNYYFTIDSTGINQIALYKNGVWKQGFYNNKTKLINGDYDEIKISVVKEGFVNIQLEEGTQSSSYKPYKYDKKDILIKEPLRSVGNIQDVLYEDNGQVKIDRYIKQYTFTGDEENISINMSYNTESMAVFSIVSDVFNDKKEVSSQYDATSLFCNNFLCGSWFDIYSSKVSKEMIASSTDNNSVIYFKILKSKLTTPDVNGFKAWLKANPTTIIYQLATPTVEIVENCVYIDLKTFNEKTYVSFENAISGTSSFKALVDSAATISRLNRENRALEEENKTLRQDFESTTLTLTDSDLELVKQNVDIDFRLMEVEFALDIPQSTLSSKFKKKGEVKSMARTPYQMLKIVILSGDYDREDYIHKVGKYYERGRMTKEEYDELMSLMTADEVISK